MSIKILGKLTIKYKNGRNGRFPVGELSCSIGNFTVKSKELEQYAEGTYDGEFVISNISIASYQFNNSITHYQVARLDDFSIVEYKTGKVAAAPVMEPDPADEEELDSSSSPAQVVSELPAASEPVTSPSEESQADADPDEALFGLEIFELLQSNAATVKLDPSVGRTLLRSQIDRLKQLGFIFEATNQVWNKKQ